MTTTEVDVGDLRMKPQDIPSDDPESRSFLAMQSRPILTTPIALDVFTSAELERVLVILEKKARSARGLDYLAVFESGNRTLFVVDDGHAVTLMLPSDY